MRSDTIHRRPTPPRATSRGWNEELEADIQQDYFSTLSADGFGPADGLAEHDETLAVARLPLAFSRTPSAAANLPLRESVRPIPIARPVRYTPVRFSPVHYTLVDLAARENWLSRFVGIALAVAIGCGYAVVELRLRVEVTSTAAFSSPTLNGLAHRGDRLLDRLSAAASRRFELPQAVLATRDWLTVRQPIAAVPAAALVVTIVASLAIYLLGRKMAGVFGGLLAVLVYVTGVNLLRLLTTSSSCTPAILANGFAVVGIYAVVAGWQRSSMVPSLIGVLLCGVAAALDHWMLLMFVPLLAAGVDLPRRWSWLMAIGAAAPIAAVLLSDQHFFGLPPLTFIRGFVLPDSHSTFAGLLHASEGDVYLPVAFLIGLSVAGIGILTRVNRRWATLLLGWCLPAVAILTIHGASDSRVFLYAAAPMILGMCWLIARSPATAGLLVAAITVLSLRRGVPVVQPPAVDRSSIIAPSEKSISTERPFDSGHLIF